MEVGRWKLEAARERGARDKGQLPTSHLQLPTLKLQKEILKLNASCSY